MPLADFVSYFLTFLEHRWEHTLQDLAYCQACWDGSGDLNWLIRLAHIREGLKQYAEALRLWEQRQHQFPERPEFARLVARAQQHMTQSGLVPGSDDTARE